MDVGHLENVQGGGGYPPKSLNPKSVKMEQKLLSSFYVKRCSRQFVLRGWGQTPQELQKEFLAP